MRTFNFSLSTKYNSTPLIGPRIFNKKLASAARSRETVEASRCTTAHKVSCYASLDTRHMARCRLRLAAVDGVYVLCASSREVFSGESRVDTVWSSLFWWLLGSCLLSHRLGYQKQFSLAPTPRRPASSANVFSAVTLSKVYQKTLITV